jgi:ribosome modulation factor
MELRLYTAYERDYNAGVAEQAREVPEDVRLSVSNVSAEWYQGYDDAVSDTPDEQSRTQAGFQGNRSAST